MFMLEELLRNEYSNELVDDIFNTYKTKRKTTARINTILASKEEVLSELDKLGIKYSFVSWFEYALIFECDEKIIQETNLYKEGKIYLQSLSSMIPPLILNPDVNDTVLDMASAPGSKTSEIASFGVKSLTAVEKDKIRGERLKYNLEHLGCKNINVMIMDALKLDDFFRFDKIQLDSPCSGSGTINNQESTDFINIDNLNKLSELQYYLLKKGISLLNNNKEIVYSTCSILSVENEGVINKILKDGNVEIIPIEINGLPTLPSTIEGVLKVKPTEEYEGFFVCKLRKIK